MSRKTTLFLALAIGLALICLSTPVSADYGGADLWIEEVQSNIIIWTQVYGEGPFIVKFPYEAGGYPYNPFHLINYHTNVTGGTWSFESGYVSWSGTFPRHHVGNDWPRIGLELAPQQEGYFVWDVIIVDGSYQYVVSTWWDNRPATPTATPTATTTSTPTNITVYLPLLSR